MKYLDQHKLTEMLTARAGEYLADGRLGGSGFCVLQNGKVLYKQYFGKKNHAADIGMEDGDRVIFRLASMTKPITTVATLIQVDRGLISLDDRIDKYLPAFAQMYVGKLTPEKTVVPDAPARHALTVRMMLNHTNGLDAGAIGNAQTGKMTAGDRHDLEHTVAFLSGIALDFEPTEAQFYSAWAAFDVCARIVELTSGMPFDEFVKKNITDPCGMTDTTFAPTAEQWDRMVCMHKRNGLQNEDAATTPGCVFENFPVTWFCGGAGLAATMPDYIRFAEMLRLGGVTPDGRRVLSEQAVRAMGTPTVDDKVMPGPQKWGLGVRVIEEGHWMPAHCFGWSGAYGTHYWVDPDNQITAVMMRNSRYDGGAGAAAANQFEQDVYACFAD